VSRLDAKRSDDIVAADACNIRDIFTHAAPPALFYAPARAESGEVVQLHFPLFNNAPNATGSLGAKIHPDPAFMAVDTDTITYGTIAGGSSSLGSAITATILPTPTRAA